MIDTLASQIIQGAKARRIMIATAESCTGGKVSTAITDIPGSSAVFDRGFITYTNESKQTMLNVLPETLAKFGAVSEQVATEMAIGALQASNAGMTISVTGIAGPGGSDNKPEGRVCFARANQEGEVISETVDYGALGRAAVRNSATDHALTLLLKALTQ